ncbi:MAG: hypothetical protein O7G88_21365 [bacterium]|nr:hypothetical protein [bacterium]
MNNDPSENSAFDDPDMHAFAEEQEPLTIEEAAMPYPAEEEGEYMPTSEIERAIHKHDQQLLSIDGVEGMGTGQDEIGDSVIVVYLSDETVRQRIPSALEGFPVRIEMVPGGFHAL